MTKEQLDKGQKLYKEIMELKDFIRCMEGVDTIEFSYNDDEGNQGLSWIENLENEDVDTVTKLVFEAHKDLIGKSKVKLSRLETQFEKL
jgi:hypothetical protein